MIIKIQFQKFNFWNTIIFCFCIETFITWSTVSLFQYFFLSFWRGIRSFGSSKLIIFFILSDCTFYLKQNQTAHKIVSLTIRFAREFPLVPPVPWQMAILSHFVPALDPRSWTNGIEDKLEPRTSLVLFAENVEATIVVSVHDVATLRLIRLLESVDPIFFL